MQHNVLLVAFFAMAVIGDLFGGQHLSSCWQWKRQEGHLVVLIQVMDQYSLSPDAAAATDENLLGANPMDGSAQERT